MKPNPFKPQPPEDVYGNIPKTVPPEHQEPWLEVGNDGHPEPGTPVWVRLKLTAPGKDFGEPMIAVAVSKRRGTYWKFLNEVSDEAINDYDVWTWIKMPPYSEASPRKPQ